MGSRTRSTGTSSKGAIKEFEVIPKELVLELVILERVPKIFLGSILFILFLKK